VYRLDDGYGAAPSVLQLGARGEGGGPVYHQHIKVRIEGSVVLHDLVCGLAFIYSPIHSSYHVEFLSSDSNRTMHHAASVADHVWTVYAHRRGIRWAEERVILSTIIKIITSQAKDRKAKSDRKKQSSWDQLRHQIEI